MGFPRLRFGPEVPSPDTEEGVTFGLRATVVMAVIFLVTGFIYATGIEEGSRVAGIVLLIAAVGCIYPGWFLVRTRRRLREAAAQRRDIAS